MGKRAERSVSQRVILILLVFFAAVFLLGGIRLAMVLREYRTGEEAYADLSESVQLTPEPHPEETPPRWPIIDFGTLAGINPEVVGWIIVDDTGINYPIVQGENNKYYLNHLFTGEKNRAGCVFLDSATAADFSDKNSVIYGHYLNDGTMFSALLQYKQQAYYDAHPTGWLVTPEKGYRVHFFAGFVSSVQGEAWERSPDENWPERMIEKSRFAGSVAPKEGDKFLTLSTCSYEFKNARFVLIGTLEEIT